MGEKWEAVRFRFSLKKMGLEIRAKKRKWERRRGEMERCELLLN